MKPTKRRASSISMRAPIRTAILVGTLGICCAATLRGSCYVDRPEECAVIRLVNHAGQVIDATFVNNNPQGALRPNEATDAILEPRTGSNVDAFWETGIGPDNVRRIEWHGGFRNPLDACHIYVFYFLPGGTWQPGEVLTKPCKAKEPPPANRTGQPSSQTQTQTQTQQASPAKREAVQRKAEQLLAEVAAGQRSANAAIKELDAFVTSLGTRYDAAGLTWRSEIHQRFVTAEAQKGSTLQRQQQQAREQEEARRLESARQEEARRQQLREQAIREEQARWRALQEAAARQMREAQEKQRQQWEELKRRIAEMQANIERTQEINRQAQQTFESSNREARAAAESSREIERDKMVADSVRNWKAPKEYSTGEPAAVEVVDPFAAGSSQARSTRMLEVVPTALKFDTTKGQPQTADVMLVSSDQVFQPVVKEIVRVAGLEVLILPATGEERLPDRHGSQFRVYGRLNQQAASGLISGEIRLSAGPTGNETITIPVLGIVR